MLGMVRQLYLGENENGKLWMVNRIKSGICSDNRNAHDAHIQLDSAYGRAVRVGLQVKDDISCAMLSEYSSSYNTLVNGKSIQRIATVKIMISYQ